MIEIKLLTNINDQHIVSPNICAQQVRTSQMRDAIFWNVIIIIAS